MHDVLFCCQAHHRSTTHIRGIQWIRLMTRSVLLNCDDNVQMSNNEQATLTNFVLDKDERMNVNKEEKMIVDTDQKEETSAKVNENAAQLVSSVDEMKPVKEDEEEQRYLGGFDLYSLHPAQRDLYRRIYQQPKTSGCRRRHEDERKSRVPSKMVMFSNIVLSESFVLFTVERFVILIK